jgi:hypothetical protein
VGEKAAQLARCPSCRPRAPERGRIGHRHRASNFEAADRQGRALTGDERLHVEGLLRRGKELHANASQWADIGQAFGSGPVHAKDPSGSRTSGLTMGEQFVSSEGYKAIRHSRGESWTTGLIEVGPALNAKGTLLEGVGSPGSGSGGGLVPTPQVVPGVVSTLFRPLLLEDFLLSGQATGNSVRYAVEGTATSAAVGVAEGGQKPESTLGFSTSDEPSRRSPPP